jgi:dihydroflavonol-4-reductase
MSTTVGFKHRFSVSVHGAKVPRKSCRMPRTNYTWLYAKALLQDKLPAVMPGKPLVEPYRMRVFGGSYHCDSARAVRELGFACPPLKQMLQDCAD